MSKDSDERTGTRDAIAVVESFLEAIGRGDHESAARHLADGVSIVFPGGRRYSTLEQLAEASASRYRSVDKHRDEYDAFVAENGDVMVISMGRLFGENRFGVPFDNVRYVDRFRLRDGRIIDQRVWNDLAETGVLTARAPGDMDQAWRVVRRETHA